MEEKVKGCMPPEPRNGEWMGICIGCFKIVTEHGRSHKKPEKENCKECGKRIVWSFDDRMRYD